jgi:predicted phosphodiesterase
MKIKLISDVHVEFDGEDDGFTFLTTLPNKDVDVLVVAGDLGVKKLISPALKLLCQRFPHVVYVTGNHDNWYGAIDDKIKEFEALDAEVENFYFLENKRIEIEGQGFAGCTLWFSPHPMTRGTWIDFRMVESGSVAVYRQNALSKQFLRNEVKEGDVVVTHHLPSPKCVHPQWEGMPTNCYFVCDMEDVMLNNKPAYWLFGHTHDRIDVTIGETQCLCNPRGYPHEGVNFDEYFVIDTDLDKKEKEG